jgi:hypothetical protein
MSLFPNIPVLSLTAALLARLRPAPRCGLLSACALAVLLTGAIPAADSASAGAVLPPAVFVPYEKLPDTALGNQGVFMPYGEFLRMWNAANPVAPVAVQPPVGAALTGYTLTGAVSGEAAQLDLAGSAAGLSQGWSEIALPGDLSLTAFSAPDPRVVLRRDDDHLSLDLPAAGTYAFSGTMAAAVTREASGRRTMVLNLPGGPAGRLDLLIPDGQAEITLNPALAATSDAVPGGTRLRCVLGGARQLTISWQPPVQAVGGDALVLATVDVQVTVGERSLRYDAVVGLDILRRGLADITVALPTGTQVLAVEAPGLRTWEKTGDDAASQVVMHLQEPALGKWRAVLRCERLLPALAVGETRALAVPWPVVVGAARTTGSVAFVGGGSDAATGDGLTVTIDSHDGLSQVDPGALGLTAAIASYRFLAPPAPAQVSVVRREPEVRAAVHQLVRLGTDEDLITAIVQLDVRRAGLFSLALTAPADWELVDAGGLALDDTRRGADVDAAGLRTWELVLRNRLAGTGELTLRFHAPPSIPHLTASATPAAAVALAPLPVLHPLGCRQWRGSLLVAAPASWALTSTARTGLTGAEAEPLRREGPLASAAHDLRDDEDLPLAFTYIASDPAAAAPAVTLSASARARELSLRQEEALTIAEGNLRRSVTWHGEVRYSALSTLRVQVPSDLDGTISFKGEGLAEHNAVGRANGLTTWELRFQTPVLGTFTVSADYVQPLPPLSAGGTPATVAVAAFTVPDATRTQVLVAVAREGSLEISAAPAADSGMESLSPADLPPALQGPGVVAGFQAAAAGALTVTLVRRDLVALADAAVVVAHWSLVMGDDGTARVHGDLVLASRGRPALDIRLPPGANLQEVAVDRRQGRPAERADGTVVIPLGGEGSGGGNSHLVALVYEQPAANGPLGSLGAVALTLPQIGDAGADEGKGAHDPANAANAKPLPVEAVVCELWLPTRIQPWRDAGDLRVAAGSSAWSRVLELLGLPASLGAEPTASLGDDDGLTVAVPVAGVAYRFTRLGDGGAIAVSYVARGWLEGIALALAAVGLVAWLRSAAGSGRRRKLLALIAGLGLLGTSGALAVPAAGFALGVGLGAVASLAALLWRLVMRGSVLPPVFAAGAGTPARHPAHKASAPGPRPDLLADLGDPRVPGNAPATDAPPAPPGPATGPGPTDAGSQP